MQTGATIDNDGSWWVPMPSGVKFYPENPNPKDVFIGDIARKLAQQCRYGGGTVRYYSVAEHCVLLSRIEPTDEDLHRLGIVRSDETSRDFARRHFQREALLQDRVEWALQDFVRPLKEKCRPWYFTIERNLESVTAPIFHLLANPPEVVMEYDYRICVDEKRQGIACPFEPNNRFEETEPLGVNLQFWSPEVAEHQFLKRFFELYPNANARGWDVQAG